MKKYHGLHRTFNIFQKTIQEKAKTRGSIHRLSGVIETLLGLELIEDLSKHKKKKDQGLEALTGEKHE